LALDLGSGVGTSTEAAANLEIELAGMADREHQLAACTVKPALAVARAEALHPERGLEAFDLCERATEWLDAVPEQLRAGMASELMASMTSLDVLRPLAVLLMHHSNVATTVVSRSSNRDALPALASASTGSSVRREPRVSVSDSYPQRLDADCVQLTLLEASFDGRGSRLYNRARSQ
jgi:hypothetical protein